MINLTHPLSTAARSGQTATRFRLAILVSIVLHAATLWELPALPRLRPGPAEPEPYSLNVRLAPAPSPPAQSAAAPRAQASAAARPVPRASPERPAPSPAAPPSVAAAPAPARAARSAEPDLMAYVEARRRARGAANEDPASAPRAEPSDDQRANRIAMANLASANSVVFGYDPSRSGGVFTIEHMGYDYAEFTFTGWNSDARRHTKQLIEVRKGTNADIRIAIVRRMIAIIREYEPEEFTWDSQRLGRSLALSSRLRDNAGLEEFMMLEFFGGPKPLYGAVR
jgi:hypothetical protein